MELFSTVLNIRKGMDEDIFVSLIKEWIDTQPFEENRIKGISYAHESDITFGTQELWLCIRKYEAENIMAVRYEKSQADGTVWDTDYVINFRTNRLAIRLERSYHEDSLRVDARFSTPFFIAILIRHGWIEDDGILPVSQKPLIIDENNAELLAHTLSRKQNFSLPVVYISRTYYDEDPVDLIRLSRQLKGIAHIFAEKSVFTNRAIREACGGMNAYYGAVDLIWPGSDLPASRLFYRAESGEDPLLRERLVRSLIEYAGAKRLDPLETWNGVNHAILMRNMDEQTQLLKEAQAKKQEAVNEMEDVYSTFGNELEKLKKQAEELSRVAAAREYEIGKLREKLRADEDSPVLLSGKEEDFFAGEIKEMVLDALSDILASVPPESRRAHVLKDLIEHNGYEEIHKKRSDEVKKMFRDYKSMSGTMRAQLMNLGFEISEEGKHYRLCYYGDPRYKTTLAKSGSDYREGRNIAALISRSMF